MTIIKYDSLIMSATRSEDNRESDNQS